jgi:hippurate hydrolase
MSPSPAPADHIRQWLPELAAFRRDLHAHPELGFEEHRTSGAVAAALARLGVEHATGIGRTGIVAAIAGSSTASGRTIGLRADMDALPMHEENGFAHRSTIDGKTRRCCSRQRATSRRRGASTAPPT